VLATAPGFRGLALLPGAGHWAPYEAAEAFDRALLQALQAGPAVAAGRR
jgi:pimeloyl-ACP methyl ester carboxylesterase